jgi:hypothetical protein
LLGAGLFIKDAALFKLGGAEMNALLGVDLSLGCSYEQLTEPFLSLEESIGLAKVDAESEFGLDVSERGDGDWEVEVDGGTVGLGRI